MVGPAPSGRSAPDTPRVRRDHTAAAAPADRHHLSGGDLDDVGDLLGGLTPAQRHAVTVDAAPLCVLAGAGAGKTRVLTHRIAHRVATGSADAAHVLVITFTRKAAGELTSRLAGAGLGRSVHAGTFHAVAASQLRRWWSDRGVAAPTLLARKGQLLGPLAADRPDLAGVAVSELAGHLEWAKARLVGPDGFEAAVSDAQRALPVPAASVAGLYRRYEDEKRRRRLLDFDDLLARCADAFDTDGSFAAAQRWRYRHVFVDEFQDVNPLQHRLLLAWLGDGQDLCVVGDPNQAIYSWNGADPGLLDGVTKRWPSTTVVRLDANHRCSPQIVAAAAAVLGEAGAHLRSSGDDGPAPRIRSYPSDDAEAHGVAGALRAAHAAGTRWAEMAVLVRTNAQVGGLCEALARAAVPHRAPGRAPLDEADTDAAAAPVIEAAGDTDAVTICTFHRAKGLEWQAVWVCGLEVGLVPMARATGDAARAEERRLLYVALTRARAELSCSWAETRRFGGHPVARLPSPWLAAIGTDRRPGASGSEVVDRDAWRSGLREQRLRLATLERAAPAAARRRGRRGAGDADVPRGSEPHADAAVLARLVAWRASVARASGVPSHVVLHDRTLDALAALRPATGDELLAVPGVGPVKASRLGPALLALLADRQATA